MRRLLEVELDGTLPDVVLADDEDGVGLVFRFRRQPVGFALLDRPDGGRLSSDELAVLGASAGGLATVEATLRESLIPGPGPVAATTVTAAVCTHGRPALLRACLGSLVQARSAAAAAGEVELLVVDNAPPDDATRHEVERTPGVRYVREDRQGLDFARNRALHEAVGDVVAFVDDDVRVAPGWLCGLRAALGEHPDAGGVTGLVLPAELATGAQVAFERRGGFRRGFERRRFGPALRGHGLYPAGAGIFGAGCNMAFDRRLVLDLGGFDEALDTGPPLPGGGDLDMFYRVARSGRPMVYEPSMAVHHQHRREDDELRRQYWTWGTGCMAFVRKSWDADPGNRAQLAGFVAWWLQHQARGVLGRAGEPGVTPRIALTELAGGLVGLTLSYPRSVRRSRRIRRSHA